MQTRANLSNRAIPKIRATLKAAGIKLPSEKYEDEHTGVDVKKTVGTEEVQNDPEACWPSRFGNSAEGVKGATACQTSRKTSPSDSLSHEYRGRGRAPIQTDNHPFLLR